MRHKKRGINKGNIINTKSERSEKYQPVKCNRCWRCKFFWRSHYSRNVSSCGMAL